MGFLCFSGRICVFIYYMVYKVQAPAEPEAAPLILESEYFPRPSGYGGYCMLGQDDPGDSRPVLVEAGAAGLLISPSIEIGSFSALENSPANFPKGILTPERNRRHQREASLKSVSFNPRTELRFLEEQ